MQNRSDTRLTRRGWLWIAAAVIIAVPLITLFVARIGGDDAAEQPAGADFADFEEILASDITIEYDPAGGSGALQVTTSVDAVCAVVYGTDDSFGMIATDSDMAGGAHRDHHPVLGGLEPDTRYFYRLQGVDADGIIYVSEVMTFTTGSAIEEATRPNLALSAEVIDVSSEFSDIFRAENAIDGSLSTEWSSAGDGDAASIVIDLGEPQRVSGVGFRTREMGDGSAITNSFTVTVDDGETLGPFEAGPGLSVADVEFTGQIIRIDVESSTGGNTGAVEIEIYG